MMDSPLMSLTQLVLVSGFAYFPLFVLEYAVLDQWRDSITTRRETRSETDKVYDFIVGTSYVVICSWTVTVT